MVYTEAGKTAGAKRTAASAVPGPAAAVDGESEDEEDVDIDAI